MTGVTGICIQGEEQKRKDTALLFFHLEKLFPVSQGVCNPPVDGVGHFGSCKRAGMSALRADLKSTKRILA